VHGGSHRLPAQRTRGAVQTDPMTVLDLLAFAVLALVGLRLAEAAQSSVESRRRALGVVRGLRWRHFALAVPVIAAVVLVASVLIRLPILSYGWWTALGGVGNPVVGVTERDLGVLDVLIPAFFLGLLVVALPLLVTREEWAFRRGAERRGSLANARWTIGFGLAHAAIGIPIGAALALSIGGVYLTACYLRGWRETRTQAGALLESTRAHLAYNLVILWVVAVALVTDA
jgi:hypothetical protein